METTTARGRLAAALNVTSADQSIEGRIAQRLAGLRAEAGWSLEVLAARTGISRATLSRLERSELSPTASMLGRLCAAYGWTLSRLMAEVELRPPNLVPAALQTEWQDPETGYCRRMVSPPAPGHRGELVEVQVPARTVVSFDAAPIPGLEHHLWLLAGALTVEVGGSRHDLRAGDCLRYLLSGPTRFRNDGKRPARYLVVLVHP